MVEIPGISFGELGENNGCGWKNSVARNRVVEKIKGQSLDFSELRQLAEHTLRFDIKSFIAEKKRMPAFTVEYQLDNRGLTIIGGGMDGQPFSDFIDRARILGPKLEYQADEQELNRLEAIEQAFINGAQKVVTAAGKDEAYRYLQIWERQGNIVKMISRDISTFKKDLNAGEAAKLVEKIASQQKLKRASNDRLLWIEPQMLKKPKPLVFAKHESEPVKMIRSGIQQIPEVKPLMHVRVEPKILRFDVIMSVKKITSRLEAGFKRVILKLKKIYPLLKLKKKKIIGSVKERVSQVFLKVKDSIKVNKISIRRRVEVSIIKLRHKAEFIFNKFIGSHPVATKTEKITATLPRTDVKEKIFTKKFKDKKKFTIVIIEKWIKIFRKLDSSLNLHKSTVNETIDKEKVVRGISLKAEKARLVTVHKNLFIIFSNIFAFISIVNRIGLNVVQKKKQEILIKQAKKDLTLPFRMEITRYFFRFLGIRKKFINLFINKIEQSDSNKKTEKLMLVKHMQLIKLFLVLLKWGTDMLERPAGIITCQHGFNNVPIVYKISKTRIIFDFKWNLRSGSVNIASAGFKEAYGF